MKLPKQYEPDLYEQDIYALWEKSEAFLPVNRGSHKTFSIVVPPPNANGNLHLGHGLTLAVEDIAIRYHRMKGEAALFVPGADHAGFETWVVYEKYLASQGKTRFDYTREELYHQIWDFVGQNKDNYLTQFRKLGASVDWSRYVYTLDQKIVNQAYESFGKMFNEGLIYRAEKLVNFCTFHGTGFADIEVAYKEETGNLWYIRYPLTGKGGEVVIATTRPETMLGDTAVAVHPEDSRYKKLIGKTVTLPLTGREVPIIADDFVEKDFGTGAVKITPAHDLNDYEAALRHDLPMIHVIGPDGKLVEDMPKAYRGLTVEDARAKVVDDLEKQDLIVKTEEIVHNVGHCYKCDTVIEPLLREQWFIEVKQLTEPAIKALKAGNITFYPSVKCKQLITYLENLRDWNISRQIAWGIPIPAFQNVDDPEDWIFDDRVAEETIEVDGNTYRRDPDVFDTWFSSSSWPYATLNFPEGDEFKKFYPLSLMETGADILYPWVSRMILFGLYNTGEVPFKEVYLHGLIQDEHGQKMSKSKGNVINPMEKIDQFGSDAFRLGIIAGETAGSNRPYDESKLVGGRNFCNKLWNVARFVEDKLGDKFTAKHDPKPETAADHWILHKLQQSIREIDKHLDKFRFSEAYDLLYHTVWDDFADWYIEASKGQANAGILAYALETLVKLAHPFAPFLTETIWQTLAWEPDSILAVTAWPKAPAHDAGKAAEFEEIKTIVTESRTIISTLQLQKSTLYFTAVPFLAENAELIKKLAGLAGVREVDSGHGLHLTSTAYACWLDIDHDTARRYLATLQQKHAEQGIVVKRLHGRLQSESYVKNAPKALVEQSRQQLEEATRLLGHISAEIKRFSDIAES